MQRIKLYSIVSPCQCTGSPAGTVILIAADPGDVVLDNHGSDVRLQFASNKPRKEAAVRRGPRSDTITGTAAAVAAQQQAFQSSCDSKGQQ